MNKRGQFFLLAAVILSSILVTLTSTVNYARVSKEPKQFYDLSNDIKMEGAEVLNYGVYNHTSNAIGDFSSKLGDYLADSNPDTELFLIYGNASEIVIENYAKDDLEASISGNLANTRGCQKALAGSISISVGGSSFLTSEASATARDYYGRCISRIPISATDNNLEVKISNQVYNFSLGKDQKFLLITRKKIGNETYINLK